MKTIRYKITVLLSILPLSAGLVSCVEEGTYDDCYVTEKPNISYPTLSSVTVLNVTHCSASFEAKVISDGNLEITDAGFVLSTSPEQTPEDELFSCGATDSLSVQTNELQPNTTYYVRAYAQNKRGTATGSVSSFTTTDGTSIDYDDYNDDNNLNDSSGGSIIGHGDFGQDNNFNDSSGGSIIGRGDYGDDNDLNDSSGGSIIGRGGYGDDNDLNDSSGGSIIGRDGYSDDNDLNDSSGGSIIGRDGYDEDNDLNNSSGGSIIGREGFGEDEDLNSSSVSSNGPVGNSNEDNNNNNNNNNNIINS